MAILGIDLGTTNSLGAVYRNGKVELIPNRFGSFLTPSVVSVTEDGSVVTGQIAKERLITHPKDTAFSFKKNMGSDQKYNLGGKTFLPEELSGFIVSAIVEDAKEYMGEEIKDVIISVPAYFHDKQRVATKRAGALAGVNVKRIVNEPSAAALASYFDTQNEQLFLVFDFGGGTLDVSIVDCFDTMVDILAVSGDNHLGGDDFNEAVAEGFLREHQLQRGNLSEKEYAILLRQAEKCKIALSTEKEVKMTAVLGGQTYQSVYTNERMMRESSAVWKRIQTVLRRALRDSRVEVEDIDAVILAGGSGTGKTYIAAGLVHEAVKNGYRAYMVTLEDLLTCLKTRDVSRHAMKTYKRITKAQLLAIDNATLFPLKRENVMLLFKLVNEFQEKTSLIVTANYSLTE